MLPERSGSFHFFTFRGIDVSIHWMWFLFAAWRIDENKGAYSSILWTGIEYLSVFAIVLLHEFGHALACRQVGGQANRIVLWPLGGVAFVSPPQRPGPILWSIAAGPLVNVALYPLTEWARAHIGDASWASADVVRLVHQIWFMNLGLLAFNMLPVYPLDGGQILQSLLWFAMGRVRSMYVVTVIGAFASLGVMYVAWERRDFILGIVGFFVLAQCKAGFEFARRLSEFERAQRF